VSAVLDQQIHVFIAERDDPGMDLAAKVLAAVVGLVRGRRAAAVQVRGDRRKGRAHREGLQRHQNTTARCCLDLGEHGEVVHETALMLNVYGSRPVSYGFFSICGGVVNAAHRVAVEGAGGFVATSGASAGGFRVRIRGLEAKGRRCETALAVVHAGRRSLRGRGVGKAMVRASAIQAAAAYSTGGSWRGGFRR
jgi:hypothetical protein